MSATVTSSKILSTANNDFTVSLYRALFPSTKKGNLIFSPFSLHAVLGMVAQGAGGDTKDELLDGLALKKSSDESIAKSYKILITGFEKRSSATTFTLLTANRVYSRTGYGLNPAFVKNLKNNFQADFVQIDFSNLSKCKAAANKINKWVEATTNNKIKNLISPDALDTDTALVLVNAIYFKGYWRYQFNKSKTSKAAFHVTPKKTVDVDMMRKDEKFEYGKLPKLKAEAVAMPYRGGRLSMVIILPNDVTGLDLVQKNIGSILQDGKSLVKDSLSITYKVELRLPKFKVEATLGNLDDVLKDDLGFQSMYDEEEADFSGITDGKKSPELFVSSVIQKAFIEVNEDGAEAAAASAVGMAMKKGPGRPQPKTIPFVVDHPFYFQIVDNANGELVLFSGHVNDPSLQ